MAFFVRFWKGYESLLLRRPIVTKAVTASCIMSLGDISSQKLESHFDPNKSTTFSWDIVRTARMASIGLTVTGPGWTLWSLFLYACVFSVCVCAVLCCARVCCMCVLSVCMCVRCVCLYVLCVSEYVFCANFLYFFWGCICVFSVCAYIPECICLCMWGPISLLNPVNAICVYCLLWCVFWVWRAACVLESQYLKHNNTAAILVFETDVNVWLI